MAKWPEDHPGLFQVGDLPIFSPSRKIMGRAKNVRFDDLIGMTVEMDVPNLSPEAFKLITGMSISDGHYHTP